MISVCKETIMIKRIRLHDIRALLNILATHKDQIIRIWWKIFGISINGDRSWLIRNTWTYKIFKKVL